MAHSATIGRRTFVLGAAALTTAAVAEMSLIAGRSPAAAAATTFAWTLNTTNWSSPRGYPLRTHCKCSACVSHAANKIFATLRDAQDSHLRAHPGCLCEPEQIELSDTVWTTLFTTIAVVDRRDPNVATVLAAGHVALPVSASPVVTPQLDSAPVSLRSARAGVSAQNNSSSAGLLAGAPALGVAAANTSRAKPLGPAKPSTARTSPSPSTSTSPSPSPSPSSHAPGESVVKANAPGAGSHPSDLTWISLPVVGVGAGLGLLIWWRRRNDEQQTETTACTPDR
jgi:hypothetical protein